MNQPINNTWTDFNDAEVQQDFDLIPRGTIAKVNLTLKPGGYNEPPYGLAWRLGNPPARPVPSISRPSSWCCPARMPNARCGA